MTEDDAKLHKYYKQALDAHRGTSFVPEKRAASELEYYDTTCREFNEAGKGDVIEKFTTLWLKHMAAKARIVSVMIAGGSKFPVARMEKYNRWERSAADAVAEFLNKVTRPPAPPRTELDYKIEEKTYMIGEVTVRQNVEDNRLQLLFQGKPEPDMIAKLKSRGFKWSPRNQAWQRQLTPNALLVVPHLLPTPQIK